LPLAGTSPPPGDASLLLALYTGKVSWPSPAAVEATTRMTYEVCRPKSRAPCSSPRARPATPWLPANVTGGLLAAQRRALVRVGPDAHGVRRAGVRASALSAPASAPQATTTSRSCAWPNGIQQPPDASGAVAARPIRSPRRGGVGLSLAWESGHLGQRRVRRCCCRRDSSSPPTANCRDLGRGALRVARLDVGRGGWHSGGCIAAATLSLAHSKACVAPERTVATRTRRQRRARHRTRQRSRRQPCPLTRRTAPAAGAITGGMS
jgi:hypothetical protein